MSRTYRKVSKDRVPGKIEKTGRAGDRHIQRLPERSSRHDGLSAKLDWSDEFGGLSFSKALRLTESRTITEQLTSD